MHQELISIIAPAYNHEKFIGDCLESVLSQTYPNIELIIIDDCSKDNTVGEIEKFINKKELRGKHNDYIKFIKHKENKGACFSINEGLKIAKGEYLTIINTDDIYERERLNIMIDSIKRNNSEICFSKVDTIDETGNVLRNDEWKYYNNIQQKIKRYPLVNLALITDNVAISTGNLLFTKKLYMNVGGFKDYKYIHDWDFILRATLYSEPIYVEDTNYLYRLHIANSFKKLRKNNMLCYEEGMKVLTNFCKRIQTKNYINPKIPSAAVWQYFIFSFIKNKDLAHIWNNAEIANNFRMY